MKKVLMICLMVTGIAVYAQPHGQGERGPRHEKAELMKQLSPQQRAELKTKKMVLDLNLTAAQEEQIQKLNLELATQKEANKPDRNKKEKPSATEMFERTSDLLDQKIATKRRLQGILTKEQFEKFERSQHRKKREHRHHLGSKKR